MGVDVEPRRKWWKRLLYRSIGGYVVLVMLVALIQRKLIYFPTKVDAIDPAEAELAVSEARTVTVETSDRLRLSGWLVTSVRADERASQRRPLVIYFPGNAGNRLQRAPICEVFVERGADVLLVDYRGYGENPGRPSEEGLYRDAESVWRYAVDTLHRPPGSIYLYGESIGGALAVWLASERADRGEGPAGMLLQGAFDSLVETAAYHYPWLPVRWLLTERFPSASRIGRVECSIVHLHGTLDRVVPLERGRTLFLAAPSQSRQGVTKEFVELPHHGHNDIPLDALGRSFEILLRRSAPLDAATQ